ncbi:MAG: recombinase family protein, partial [Clostridia bacterium]|nr:recombinase family protein [Clostridia bacterium]
MKCGVYMRLSRDDEKSGESMSIENQRVILSKYVAEQGGAIIDEYVDDGWSGTNFDRPGVKRLLEDAQAGRIDTIVVKDLSRFGRNYIQVGQYVDYIFPAYGIRFIALGDNVDTADRSSAAMDMMPIMNVFNEWHAANTSKKIRTVLEASQRAGKYTNWSYPYGYKAGTDVNRTAVIDEAAAEVVRRIYNLRAEGKSYGAIARILTDACVPNPATYFTRLNGEKSERRCSPRWVAKTVMWILSNPTYTGSTVQHKTTSVSYKNHKIINVPENLQIVKENAHEAIISRDLWDRVQAINNCASRGKADKTKRVHALSGMLVCADCGKKLKIKSGENRAYFVCRTYADLGKKYCSSHSINESVLQEVILRDIRSMLDDAEIDFDGARDKFIKEKTRRGAQTRYSDEKRLKSDRERLTQLNKLIQAAFEDKVLKGMPESVCLSLCEKYQSEKTAVEEEIDKIERRLAEADVGGESADGYVKKLKEYVACPTLTRELCLHVIDFITVGEQN